MLDSKIIQELEKLKMKKETSICIALVIFLLFITAGLFPVKLLGQQIPEQYRENFSNSFPIRKDQHLEIKSYADKLLEENIKTSAICDLDTRINYHSFGPEAVKRGYIVWAPALAMNCGIALKIKIAAPITCLMLIY
jgi:hypothetical protein